LSLLQNQSGILGQWPKLDFAYWIFASLPVWAAFAKKAKTPKLMLVGIKAGLERFAFEPLLIALCVKRP
jgi:hypothetical protein